MRTTATLPPASEVPRPGDDDGPRPSGQLRSPGLGHPTTPLVSVVIPVRDEADHLDRCLRAVLAQDLPADALEVLVVDGASADGSVDVARAVLAAGDRPHRVIHNPDATTPSNLNAGLAVAQGRYVCRVDARSFVPPDYVRRCLAVLEADPGIAVVGGAQVAEPAASGVVPRAIALALNNPYGMGGSPYRAAGRSGPTDTVYLGFFRRAELAAVGGWDPRLPTNQDFDLNRRLSRVGTVWYEDGLRVGYLPRPTLRRLAQQYHRFGRAKVRYWRLSHDRPRPRQLLLLAAPIAALAAGAGLAAGARRPGWPRLGALAGAAALLAGAAAVARCGELDERPSFGERALSLGALALVGTAWTTGVWREVLGGR